MTKAPDEPKRGRGRPRMAPDEKKRRNMTFRVRDELRDAVEELAKANGRSLSEQVEYYVESSVISEIGLTYQYSTDALSPTLFRFSATKTKELESGKMLPVKFPDGQREMLTFTGENCLNTPSDGSLVPRVQEPGGHQHAIEMARSLIDGIVRGALEGLEATLGPKVIADLQSNLRIGESEVSMKLKRAYQELELRCKAAESRIENLQFSKDQIEKHLQSQIDDYHRMLAGPGTLEGDFERVVSDLAKNTAGLAPMYPRMPMPADLPPTSPPGDGDFSIATLRDLVGRFLEPSPDLKALRAAGWPSRFGVLPLETRTALMGDLPGQASNLYETLMSPSSARSEALSALRRFQGLLLGGDAIDELDDDRRDMKGRRTRARG